MHWGHHFIITVSHGVKFKLWITKVNLLLAKLWSNSCVFFLYFPLSSLVNHITSHEPHIKFCCVLMWQNISFPYASSFFFFQKNIHGDWYAQVVLSETQLFCSQLQYTESKPFKSYFFLSACIHTQVLTTKQNLGIISPTTCTNRVTWTCCTHL